MKKLFWSNMNYFFQPQTHCFKFQLPSNKKFITCANFSNTNIHFYNAKGEAIFTHSSENVFLGALELILRAGASVKKKLSSMQTTFGTVFTKTFKYQKQLQPGILLFPYI